MKKASPPVIAVLTLTLAATESLTGRANAEPGARQRQGIPTEPTPIA